MNKLFLDFDDTFTPTGSTLLKTYESLTGEKMPDVALEWDFTDANINKEYIYKLFDSSILFDNLKPFDNTVETVKNLSKITDVNFVTIGTYKNIKLKIDFLEKLGLQNYVGMIPIISNSKAVMNKSIIIGDAILVDDHPQNLITCSAKYKVLYSNNGLDYGWQRGYKDKFNYNATKWDKTFENVLIDMIYDKF